MYEILKIVSKTEIVTCEYGLYDKCGNGYDHFEIEADFWSTKGDRHYGTHKETGGKWFYYMQDFTSAELIAKYFSELMPVEKINGCDSFGIPIYPIINQMYYLTKGDESEAIKQLRITKNEAQEIKKLSVPYLAEFLIGKINGDYKTEVMAAINAIEKASGVPIAVKEAISPILFNDMHYTMVTEKKGWNVYKGMNPKPTEYPKNHK